MDNEKLCSAGLQDFVSGVKCASTQAISTFPTATVGAPRFQSTQKVGKPSQKQDRYRKVYEERPWSEPKRVPIVEKPIWKAVYNIFTGEYTDMLVGAEGAHDGILTEHEAAQYNAVKHQIRQGVRIALEGNIASGL